MKSKLFTVAVVAAILGGIVVINKNEPRRLAEAHYEAEKKAQQALEGADKDQRTLAEKFTDDANLQMNEAIKAFEETSAQTDESDGEEIVIAQAKPNDYRVTFECSNGEVVLDVSHELAPQGAVQFRKAVEDGVYDGARFFRVIPGFMAQFGIPGDPAKAAEWKSKVIKDDPVKASNSRGTMTFATSGPNSRTTQLFINYGDNARLDGMGFTPFARVVKGMDVVDAIFSGHRERPDQGAIQSRGNAYLEENFPELDYIIKATISEIPAATVDEEAPAETESDEEA